jgi:hypothetical protein
MPVGLSGEVGIDVVSLVGNVQGDVMHLVSDPRDVPDEMYPCIGGEGLTVIDGRLPTIDVIPDIPFARAVKVTFRSPDPAIAAKCLVDIKFQSL